MTRDQMRVHVATSSLGGSSRRSSTSWYWSWQLVHDLETTSGITSLIAVVEAAAETVGWDTRPSPKPLDTGTILTGRGIAYAYRGQTVIAQIAEVEVAKDRQVPACMVVAGINRERRLITLSRLIEAPCFAIDDAQFVVRHRMIRIELERFV